MEDLKEKVIELFKVLADETRLEILECLRDGQEKNATEIQKILNKGQSSISQQLKILVGKELLEVRKDSRNKLFKIKYREIFKLLSVSKVFISNKSKEEIEQNLEKLKDIDIRDTLL